MFFTTILPLSLSLFAASDGSALPNIARRDANVEQKCWTNGNGNFVVIIPNDGTRSSQGYDAPGNCGAGFRANLKFVNAYIVSILSCD
jgi:hypothetical protein